MPTRREILRYLTQAFVWLSAIAGFGLSKVWAGLAEIKKRILPKGTDPETLLNQNPKYLDTRNLAVMPLSAFEVMGDKEAPFNRDTWRLEVTGAVQTPVALSYDDILLLPALKREVLLVCPGVFVNNGRWKGFSVRELIKTAQPLASASKVIFHGHTRHGGRKELFTLKEVKDDTVFLAYAVNERILPIQHGFPLRVVAEGHWGSHWLKYVDKVEFSE